MRIHHCNPKRDFTIIPNATLTDGQLSYGARGVLGELLSRPEDWDTNADALARRARLDRPGRHEGRRVVRAHIAELESAGYVRRERVRAGRGRIVTVLHVSDEPAFATALPLTDIPPGGTSVPPAETGVCPGGTDVPPTDVPPGGTSIQRLTTETDHKDLEVLTSPVPVEGTHSGHIKIISEHGRRLAAS